MQISTFAPYPAPWTPSHPSAPPLALPDSVTSWGFVSTSWYCRRRSQNFALGGVVAVVVGSSGAGCGERWCMFLEIGPLSRGGVRADEYQCPCPARGRALTPCPPLHSLVALLASITYLGLNHLGTAGGAREFFAWGGLGVNGGQGVCGRVWGAVAPVLEDSRLHQEVHP